MQNSLNENKFRFEACTELYEEMQANDLVKLEVELNNKMIIFSINWVDHDISIAGITIEQARLLNEKLKIMIDKVHYDETMEYYKKYKKMKLKRSKPLK
ncbi:MAG: hypothetical protein EHM58_00415 [Ignavibacteriae bacterium]|nr:MAG: hypothetical protein EHM58_00415 [Ignavibacteriota bacterium]